MSSTFNRPRDIINYCLKPLDMKADDPAYKEAYHRLEHVIRTYQSQIAKANQPVAVDFSKMPTITINEDAHGND